MDFFTSVWNIFWGRYFTKKKNEGSHGFIFISRKGGSVNFSSVIVCNVGIFLRRKKKYSSMDDRFPKEKLPVLDRHECSVRYNVHV